MMRNSERKGTCIKLKMNWKQRMKSLACKIRPPSPAVALMTLMISWTSTLIQTEVQTVDHHIDPRHQHGLQWQYGLEHQHIPQR